MEPEKVNEVVVSHKQHLKALARLGEVTDEAMMLRRALREIVKRYEEEDLKGAVLAWQLWQIATEALK